MNANETSWEPLGDSRPSCELAVRSTDGGRVMHLTPASSIRVRPVRWLWHGRLPLGALSLLGGRENVGKSAIAYTLAAAVTHGRLPGVYFGTPKSIIVAATEDSWEHTVVPRLMAAGADLTRVFRADVEVKNVSGPTLVLPRDVDVLLKSIQLVDAVLVILDPLLSRLDAKLNAHVDQEVRQALEPMVAMADAAQVCVLGLIHVNKSKSSDPLTMLMASRAFAAVARAVLFAMVDPDDDSRHLLGLAKNNLGRLDLPTLAYRIHDTHVVDTDEGEVRTGKLEWLGEVTSSIADAVESAAGPSEDRTATKDAADWLRDYLTSHGGASESKAAKAAGRAAGHSEAALHRARKSLGVISADTGGFPRRTDWALPQSCQASTPKTTETTGTTATTETTGNSLQSLQSLQSFQSLQGRESETTAPVAPFVFDGDPFGKGDA